MFLENNIAYQNQTLSSEKLQALLWLLKEQKTQNNSWFCCKQVQEMPIRALPETVVYQGQVDKGKYCQDIVIKKRLLLINSVVSPKQKLN